MTVGGANENDDAPRILLLASAASALAEEWISFSMIEGSDLGLDRSSIRRDTEGAIVPWGKGWITAKTMRSEGSYASPGYFVTDCEDLYYVLTVNPQNGSIEDHGAQPLHITAGTVAQQIQKVVCGAAK
jgi:hypothetical protein